MRLFVDTEFTDLLDCELLSIGIVSEDAREFYMERNDVDLGRCGDFARVAVLPQLGQQPGLVASEAELGRRLKAWLAAFEPAPGGSPVLVSVDHPTDWELFTYLVRDEETLQMPAWLKGQSIRGAVDPREVERYWNIHGRRAHHALHDARALRAAWQASGGELPMDGSRPGQGSGLDFRLKT